MGIISNLASAPYKSERVEAWLKVKARQREKFPVVGLVKDPSGVAAIYLGKQEGNELRYIGKVGTGWSRTVSSQIRKQLNTVVTPNSKLTKPVRMPNATWVEPTYFADVRIPRHHLGRLAAGQLFQEAGQRQLGKRRERARVGRSSSPKRICCSVFSQGCVWLCSG